MRKQGPEPFKSRLNLIDQETISHWAGKTESVYAGESDWEMEGSLSCWDMWDKTRSSIESQLWGYVLGVRMKGERMGGMFVDWENGMKHCARGVNTVILDFSVYAMLGNLSIKYIQSYEFKIRNKSKWKLKWEKNHNSIINLNL